ncbi:hypothetical protein, partial [Chryseobacterium indoltheticum]|uniref:hypothetical protein n=1 Tax=Chryseobacterium indoltheticum TaxID=254 RepID=UPI003F49B100
IVLASFSCQDVGLFNPGRKKQNRVFAFIVKRFRVFRAPLQLQIFSVRKAIIFIYRKILPVNAEVLFVDCHIPLLLVVRLEWLPVILRYIDLSSYFYVFFGSCNFTFIYRF